MAAQITQELISDSQHCFQPAGGSRIWDLTYHTGRTCYRSKVSLTSLLAGQFGFAGVFCFALRQIQALVLEGVVSVLQFCSGVALCEL